MNKRTVKTLCLTAVSMLATLCLCAVVIVSGGDAVPVAALDGTSTTTTAVHCYATQLDYDASPMHVGETRAIRFYHPADGTATGGQISEISPLLSVSYEEGSDTVYVTALATGEASLYILADDCAFGAYAYLTVEAASSTTTTVHCFTTTTTTVCGVTPDPEDINFDGFVNMMDVQQLYVNVSTGEVVYTYGGILCDMNADGVVNMMDVLLLYAQVSGGGMAYD